MAWSTKAQLNRIDEIQSGYKTVPEHDAW